MKKKYIASIIIIMLCISLIIIVQKKINQIRVSEKLAVLTSIDNLPPGIAFVNVGLGAFKGIVSDILWIKAISLQQQGKYFEMGKIAFWITQLNPQFTGATTFLAWNMAYNISIMYADPKDKWKWIENAIDVLKKAIQYNPNAPDLYNELAWIFLNKISDVFDSGNLYYKTQIAFEMQKIIGKNPSDEFWNSLALAKSSNDDEFYQRKEQLKNVFMIEPEYIIDINKKFGTLDWRVSQSLAIYWAYKGTLIPGNAKECLKTLVLSLVSYSYNGKLLFFDEKDYLAFMSMPDFIMIERMDSFFKKQLESTDRDSYAGTYFTFLNKALEKSCLFGRLAMAQTLFNDMKHYFTNVDYANFEEYYKNFPESYLSGKNKNEFIELQNEHLRIAAALSLAPDGKSPSDDIVKTWKLLYDTYAKLNPSIKLLAFEKYFDTEKAEFIKIKEY